MRVLHYIKEALHHHDCVILVNFGGFLSEPKSAEINALTHTFSPPQTDISFNASLTKEDGLLRSEISGGENVSLEAAGELIKEFVADLKNNLYLNQKHELDGLGWFQLENGNLIYHADNLENLNNEGFGLPSFKFAPIERETEEMKRVRPVQPARRVIRRQPEAKKAIQSEIKHADKKLGTLATHAQEDNSTEEEKSINNKKSVYLLIPLFILLFAGGLAGYLVYNKSNKDAQMASNTAENEVNQDEAGLLSSTTNSYANTGIEATSNENATVSDFNEKGSDATESDNLSASESIAPIDSEIDNTDELVEETIEPTNTISENSSLLAESAPSSGFDVSSVDGSFHIIGNVFGVESNAVKYSNKNTGSKIVKIGHLYHVVLNSYNSLDEASRALPNMRNQHGYDVWVKKY